jgi:CPA2 family monovalent cation:H+ antiporter-2
VSHARRLDNGLFELENTSMPLEPLIQDLAVLLCAAAFVTFLFHKIGQPVVLGYIVAGLIIGPYTPPGAWVTDLVGIRIWADIGVIFLMFSLGLEFSFRRLLQLGGGAVVIALFEVGCMFGLGYGAGRVAGWSAMDCIFLAAILSISSTTIILKSIEESGLKGQPFTETAFAVLIVEDLIAILILAALSLMGTQKEFTGLVMAQEVGKLALFVGGWFFVGHLLVPRLVRVVRKVQSDEMLTLLSLGLCFLLAVTAKHFGYSMALGAFIMGSIIAETPEAHRIIELMKPLRDLFGAVFFVSVGMLIEPKALWEHRTAVILLSLITIFGKTLSTLFSSKLMRRRTRGSVQVAFSLSQIGEFSFIIAALGVSEGVTSSFLYPLAVAISMVTTFTTPYMIRHSQRVGNWAESLKKIA